MRLIYIIILKKYNLSNYSYWASISYPCFFKISSFRKISISDFTISDTISAIVYSLFHQSLASAFVASPRRRSTSAGRKYRGSIEEILKPLDITVDEFIKICDKFTNKRIFKTDVNGNLVKDKDGNLIKLYPISSI